MCSLCECLYAAASAVSGGCLRRHGQKTVSFCGYNAVVHLFYTQKQNKTNGDGDKPETEPPDNIIRFRTFFPNSALSCNAAAAAAAAVLYKQCKLFPKPLPRVRCSDDTNTMRCVGVGGSPDWVGWAGRGDYMGKYTATDEGSIRKNFFDISIVYEFRS